MPFAVTVAAKSDVGCVRTNNEDSFGYDTTRHIYAVSDGMGGQAGGEVASELAIRTIMDGQNTPLALDSENSKDVALFNFVLAANTAIREVSSNNPHLRGMGATLVAACVDQNRLLIANVGDSRAYLIRDGGCAQLTTDHSLLEEQIRLGALARVEAENSNVASVITRALGAEDTVEPDLFSLALADDDMVLLTSDGLTRYVTAEELAATIRPDQILEDTCIRLIETAKSLGAVDNITCLLLRFRSVGPPPA